MSTTQSVKAPKRKARRTHSADDLALLSSGEVCRLLGIRRATAIGLMREMAGFVKLGRDNKVARWGLRKWQENQAKFL